MKRLYIRRRQSYGVFFYPGNSNRKQGIHTGMSHHKLAAECAFITISRKKSNKIVKNIAKYLTFMTKCVIYYINYSHHL